MRINLALQWKEQEREAFGRRKLAAFGPRFETAHAVALGCTVIAWLHELISYTLARPGLPGGAYAKRAARCVVHRPGSADHPRASFSPC